MQSNAVPLGGPLFTRPFKVLLGLGAIGIALVIWRFAVGLGASTAMSDGYPFGIWIALDVVTGTALACGGYAVALLVYIFNQGKYHPLVRPAILTSALGYTIAGLSVAIDLGRPWSMWKIPLFVRNWNMNSALLEVALCIMAYVMVLWVELSPSLLANAKHPFLVRLRTFLEKALIWVIALGILLPTMHQSSLGSMMMLAGPKLHPLWQTPLLPLLFLATCLAMGYSVVVFESIFQSIAFKRAFEARLLHSIQKIAAYGGVLFVIVRFVEIGYRGHLGRVFAFDLYGIMFWIETVLWLLPVAMMYATAVPSLGSVFRAAVVLLFAGALYRFDTYLIAFDPGPGWHYFPSIPEMFISIGLISLELAAYVLLVKKFPILTGVARTQEA